MLESESIRKYGLHIKNDKIHLQRRHIGILSPSNYIDISVVGKRKGLKAPGNSTNGQIHS